MRDRRLSLVIAPIAALWVGACSQPVIQRPAPIGEPTQPTSYQAGDRQILAGEWEYEDGAVVVLKLDERGNGPYAWKDGYLETRALNGLTWEGIWFQRENDREGGFMVEFAPDFSEGEGRWWYTRIGNDTAPTQHGGTFHLTKKSGHTNASDTPPAP